MFIHRVIIKYNYVIHLYRVYYNVVVTVRTPTKTEDEADTSSASAGITPSSSSPQLNPCDSFASSAMWTERGFRPTTNVIMSPAAAIRGTVKQQSKSNVRVSLTYTQIVKTIYIFCNWFKANNFVITCSIRSKACSFPPISAGPPLRIRLT